MLLLRRAVPYCANVRVASVALRSRAAENKIKRNRNVYTLPRAVAISAVSPQAVELAAAVNTVWPAAATPADAQLKRAAAQLLLQNAGKTYTMAQLTQSVATSVENYLELRQQLGKQLAKAIKADPNFTITEKEGHAKELVSLNARALLQVHIQQQQQQQQQQVHKEQQTTCGTTGAHTLSAQQLLQFVEGQKWHSSNHTWDVVKRAVATRIVQKANKEQLLCGGSEVATADPARYILTGFAARTTIIVAVQALRDIQTQRRQPHSHTDIATAFEGDPYLSIFKSGLTKQSVKLDINALMRDAVLAHAAARSAPEPSQSRDSNTCSTAITAASTTNSLVNVSSVSSVSSSKAVGSTSSASTVLCSAMETLVSVGDAAAGTTYQLHQQQLPGGWYQPVLGRDSSTDSSTDSTSAGSTGSVGTDALDEPAESLQHVLPPSVLAHLSPYLPCQPGQPQLVEIMADAGHPVQLKLSDHSIIELPVVMSMPEALQHLEAARQLEDLGSSSSSSSSSNSTSSSDDCFHSAAEVAALLANPPSSAAVPGDEYRHLFCSDNRMGLPGTLHRISAMRDRQGKIYGLTYRIGRHIQGKAMPLADVLSSMKASIRGAAAERPQSLLLLGRPGVGKTTLLRDIARLMSLPPDQGGLGLSVVIVDTSNEIAGDATQRHPCIGAARRMMVPGREQQADVLVEAVQNHAPDVIIVDEIGTAKEVAAARTIAQRGVLLVATAHGGTLSNLLRNPELRPVVGGVQAVTLGDQAAEASNRGVKTRLERAGAATFVILLEMIQKNRWRLHLDVEQSVDILLGAPAGSGSSIASSSNSGTVVRSTEASGGSTLSHVVHTQMRERDESTGHMTVCFETASAVEQAQAAAAAVANSSD